MIICCRDETRPDWQHDRHYYTLGEQLVPVWTHRRITIIADVRMDVVKRDALIRKLDKRLPFEDGQTHTLSSLI